MISLSINLNRSTEGNCDELHLYFDESGAPSSKDQAPFSVGAIVSLTPISEDFFLNSLNLLRNDPGSDKKDEKTLERGYYHGSLDGPNAHSYCCKAIQDMPIPFEFWWNSFKKDKVTLPPEKVLKPLSLHHHLLMLVCTNYLSIQTKKIFLHVAERPGSFTIGSIESWINDYIKNIVSVVVSNPMMPMRIPDMQIEVIGPEQAGIQFVDFVLWAAQRRKFHNNDIWLKRLGIGGYFSLNDSNMAMNFENFYHIEELPVKHIRELGGIAYHAVEDLLHDTEFVNMAMPKIENAILLIGEKYLDKVSNELLADRVVLLRKRLESSGFSIRELDELCNLFILLVDDIPIYNESDKEDITHAYAAKLLCCRTLDKRGLNRAGLVTRWLAVRKRILSNNQR